MADDMLDKMQLPMANPNEELEDISSNHFVPVYDVTRVEVRKEPGRDKGIDFRMDVKARGKITGFRFIVQLKATGEMEPNKDGSVSLSIDTSNINYLLNAAIPAYYVMYFRDKNILLYRDLHEFVKQLAKENPEWDKQASNTIRLTTTFDAQAANLMCDRAIENGKFARTLTERLALSSSLVPDQIIIDPDWNVKSDSEIRRLIEDYGLYLINDSKWKDILIAHQMGSQQIASTAKYNLIIGIALYYSGELIKAISFFKSALKLRSELPVDLLEHLLLFDASVRFALGMITKESYQERISSLGKASHIRYYVKVNQIKEVYLKSGGNEIEKQYEKFVKEMEAILYAQDANENIKLLVRSEMVLYEGSKINLDFAREYASVKVYEWLIGPNRKLRQEMARSIIERKMAWADKARHIRDEVAEIKNFFVFYHVLLNETKVEYEFEVYTDLAVSDSNPMGDDRRAERKENLNSMLKNLDKAIWYFEQVTYVENICVGLSLKYEILHYMEQTEEAKKALDQLSSTIETYDLNELQSKFEALKNGGTTHEKIQAFKQQQILDAEQKQQEYETQVNEMKRLDALDAQRNIKIEDPDTIELFPIKHFQFPRSERQRVYSILNISEEAQRTFNQMMDVDGVIPIANIYHTSIEQEGHLDSTVYNNSIEAWRNIFRIRRAFFNNGFPRIELKIGRAI